MEKKKKIDQFRYVCCKANGQHTIISNCENCKRRWLFCQENWFRSF